MNTKTLLILVLFLFLSTGSILACDYCLLTQGISPLETLKGFGVRVDERYTRLSTFFDHGTKVGGSDELETHWTTQLTAFYNLKPRIAVIAVIPVARRFERAVEATIPDEPALLKTNAVQEPFHGEDGHGGVAFGLSDITLLGRFQIVRKHALTSTFITAVQAGIRIPTGRTDAKNDEGEILDAHIQPGTGAFNYLFGFSTSYAFKRLGAAANGLFSLATEGEVGPDRYEFGNSLNYDAAVRYRLNSEPLFGFNFFAALGLAGEYRQQELLNGVAVEGTGGNTLYLTPGLQIFYRAVVFEFSFWRAIHHDLKGEQLGETFKTFAGLTFLFNENF